MNRNSIEHSNQITQGLPFEVVAVPQNNVSRILNRGSKSVLAPVNFKIRIRNKEETDRYGVFSVPKLKTTSPKKVRLVNSNQTIMSFDLFVETENVKKVPKRNHYKILQLFKPGACLGLQNDDDIYPYTPSSSYERNRENSASDIIERQNNITIEETFALNKNLIPINTISNNKSKIPKTFLGKCKPGGCLDPPFSEEIYTYKPKIQILPIDQKDIENTIIISEVTPRTLYTKELKKDINESDTIDQNSLEKSSIEESYSHSLITYPNIVSSSEICIQDKNQHIKSRPSNGDKRRISKNEFSDTYYMPPKKQNIEWNEKQNLSDDIQIQNKKSDSSYTEIEAQTLTSQIKSIVSKKQILNHELEKKTNSSNPIQVIHPNINTQKTNSPIVSCGYSLNEHDNKLCNEPSTTGPFLKNDSSESILSKLQYPSNNTSETKLPTLVSLNAINNVTENKVSEEDHSISSLEIKPNNKDSTDASPELFNINTVSSTGKNAIAKISQTRPNKENMSSYTEEKLINNVSNETIDFIHSLIIQKLSQMKLPSENEVLNIKSVISCNESNVKLQNLLSSDETLRNFCDALDRLSETALSLQINTNGTKFQKLEKMSLESKNSDLSSYQIKPANSKFKNIHSQHGDEIIFSVNSTDSFLKSQLPSKEQIQSNIIEQSQEELLQNTNCEDIDYTQNDQTLGEIFFRLSSNTLTGDRIPSNVGSQDKNFEKVMKQKSLLVEDQKPYSDILSSDNKDSIDRTSSKILQSPSRKSISLLNLTNRDRGIENDLKDYIMTRLYSKLQSKETMVKNDIFKELHNTELLDVLNNKSSIESKILGDTEMKSHSLSLNDILSVHSKTLALKLLDSPTDSISEKQEKKNDVVPGTKYHSKTLQPEVKELHTLNLNQKRLKESLIDKGNNIKIKQRNKSYGNEDSLIKINLGFHAMANSKETILETFDPTLNLKLHPRGKVTVIKSVICKNDSEIRIPVNSEMDLTLQIKRALSKDDISPNNINKYVTNTFIDPANETTNNDVILHETLNCVFEHLISLEQIIKNLKQEADLLIDQQTLLKKNLNTIELKPAQIIKTSYKCSCLKNVI